MEIDLTDWIEITSEEDLPGEYGQEYQAYCAKAKLIFRRPKTFQIIHAMYDAKEVTHYRIFPKIES